jgi:hypothetical protein
MDAWAKFKQMQASGSGSVLQLQSDAYKQQVKENRHYIKTVAEVLLVTATQNMAQRGHAESESASASSQNNPGNFLKLFRLVHDMT